MNIYTLQALIDKAWTLNGYSQHFLANQMNHRDFAHAFLHVQKAMGKLANYIDDKDHIQTSSQEVRKYLADMVISILRMGNTYPSGLVDIETAVKSRIGEKFLADLKDSGIGLVLLERNRQQSEEGFDSQHDDEHEDGELAAASRTYISLKRLKGQDSVSSRSLVDWPWEPEWFKPEGPLRNMVKAAALNLAEVDRLLRLNEEIYTSIEEELEKTR
jgi:hypothetical protein